MKTRSGYAILLMALILASPIFGQAKGRSPVKVPEGTIVNPILYGDDKTQVVLKAEEQVAFLFLYSIFQIEEKCFDKDSGLGRLASLEELVKGVELANGTTVGLTEDPARDTNYRYDMIIIGTDCIMRALPVAPGLGGFAIVGTFMKFAARSTMYYNPEGADMPQASKIVERSYSGRGFSR